LIWAVFGLLFGASAGGQLPKIDLNRHTISSL